MSDKPRPAGVWVRSHQTFIASGFHLRELFVENGGTVIVESGGTASQVQVQYGGHLMIMSGGTAHQVELHDKSSATVWGTMTSACTVSEGLATVYAGIGAEISFADYSWTQECKQEKKAKKR